MAFCNRRRIKSVFPQLNTLLAICLMAIFVPSLFQGCSPGEIPEVKMESFNRPQTQTNTPCSGKERCLIAYLTPWCPSCKASAGFIQALRKKLENKDKVGLMIIIGQDQRPAIVGFGKQLPGQVFIDDQDKFPAAVRFSSVPHWWVIDKERKIKSSGAGFPGSSDTNIVDYFIEDEYGLKEFL